jgi:hypothetical protein
VTFRGKRRRKPPKFGGIFTQIRGGARHAYGYQNTCAGAFEKARNLKETRAFWRFRRNGPAKVDSFDRQRQLSRRRVQRALDDQWPNEPPFLQTLGEKTQAGAVLGQNLHVVGAPLKTDRLFGTEFIETVLLLKSSTSAPQGENDRQAVGKGGRIGHAASRRKTDLWL